MDQSPTTKGGR